MAPHFDPTDPAVAIDPYPTYEALREAVPVWYSADAGLHFITRHADVHEAWRDRRLGSDFGDREGFDAAAQVWRDPRYADFAKFERWDILALEPPDHTMLRRLVLAAFTPRAVEAQRAGIEARVRSLFDAAWERGALDMVRDVSEPLSLGVICDLIGVPIADGPYILGLSHDVVSMYEPTPPDEVKARANDAAREFMAYTHDLIRARRRDPGTDLLSGLLVAKVDGQHLGDEQIASTAMVLLMAGHEASVNAASNGVAAFAAYPDEWRALRNGMVGIGPAVEEVLRWDPPLQYFTRWVLEDGFVVGGTGGDSDVVPIPVGERVGLMIGSANRDPRRYPDPTVFRIARGETAHLSFGGGIHFCIGAPLARIELGAQFLELARRVPDLVLGDGVERRPSYQFRGYQRLPVELPRG
jgi:cytochrome P450